MQTTAEFASNSTANIKLSKHTLNKFFTKSFLVENCCFTFLVVVYYTFLKEKLHSNVAAQKLCCGVVALQIPKKLAAVLFIHVLSCKTEILIELGYTREIYLKSLKKTILQK